MKGSKLFGVSRVKCGEAADAVFPLCCAVALLEKARGIYEVPDTNLKNNNGGVSEQVWQTRRARVGQC